jgi:uncharacterized RDD family membrane protein YckC
VRPTSGSDGGETERRGFFRRAARGASERVLEVVDPDMVLSHVDVNSLLDRVDVNSLLDRVDVERLIGRVDIDALLERADIDALMERVDVRALVDRAGIHEIVAESTSHLTGSALDLFRKPIVGIDEIVFRGLNRLIGRDPRQFPPGPGTLVHWVEERTEDRTVRTGRYAGPVTRMIGFILDNLIVTFGFTLIVAGASYLVELITARRLETGQGLWYVAGFVLWAFLYLWLSVAVFGKTLGKTVMGVRVVGADGSISLQGRQAFVRAITYPLSFAALGIGLLGVVFGRERRAWHDHLARTAVVYDWGSRTARMSTPLAAWLERKGPDSQADASE